MKKIYFSLICAASCAVLCAQQPAVASFEDLNADIDSYWDGSDMQGQFVSGGYTFINNYVDWGGYGSWDGFAWSTMTSDQYTSLNDQFNACTGSGANGSTAFGVAYYSAYMGTEPTIKSAEGNSFEAKGCYVTNNAYAYSSMLNGDDYSKQFGADDWFLLTATGYKGDEAVGTATFYLAENGEIVNQWTYFDLSSLGEVEEIHFTLTSSDNGQWGMNTPAYFCVDDFGAEQGTVKVDRIQQTGVSTRYDLQGRMTGNASGLTISNGRAIFVK